MIFLVAFLSSLLQVTPQQDLPSVKVNAVTFHVEVARSDEEWRKGLMFREKLGAHEGMLFYGKLERPQIFWMKNTLVSLDIVFISKNKKIVSIAKHTEPFSETPIPSAGPAQYVLEILAGQADAAKLKPGDKVEFLPFS